MKSLKIIVRVIQRTRSYFAKRSVSNVYYWRANDKFIFLRQKQDGDSSLNKCFQILKIILCIQHPKKTFHFQTIDSLSSIAQSGNLARDVARQTHNSAPLLPPFSFVQRRCNENHSKLGIPDVYLTQQVECAPPTSDHTYVHTLALSQIASQARDKGILPYGRVTGQSRITRLIISLILSSAPPSVSLHAPRVFPFSARACAIRLMRRRRRQRVAGEGIKGEARRAALRSLANGISVGASSPSLF